MEESNILVAIRVRPLNQKEVSVDDWDIIRVEDNLIVLPILYFRSYWIPYRWNIRLKIKRC